MTLNIETRKQDDNTYLLNWRRARRTTCLVNMITQVWPEVMVSNIGNMRTKPDTPSSFH